MKRNMRHMRSSITNGASGAELVIIVSHATSVNRMMWFWLPHKLTKVSWVKLLPKRTGHFLSHPISPQKFVFFRTLSSKFKSYSTNWYNTNVLTYITKSMVIMVTRLPSIRPLLIAPSATSRQLPITLTFSNFGTVTRFERKQLPERGCPNQQL